MCQKKSKDMCNGSEHLTHVHFILSFALASQLLRRPVSMAEAEGLHEGVCPMCSGMGGCQNT